jgi:hypothetical protein
MQNTTRLSSLHLNDRQQRRPERTRARVRPVTILAKAAAYRARCSTCAVVCMVEATAIATMAMAKVASNTSKVIEAVC